MKKSPISGRREDWPVRLAEFIEERRTMPFAWGRQDCCQFARMAFKAITGIDPAKGWGLRSYKTARGALVQLQRLGGLDALPVRAGCTVIPLLMAGRGDLVIVPNADRPALGVVLGIKVAYAGEHGLEFVPLQACTAAWRVCPAVASNPLMGEKL